MDYRVTLDGIVVTDLVDGLRELNQELIRDELFHGVFVYNTSTLHFSKTAYDAIYTAWETSPCGELDCDIEARCHGGQWEMAFRGLVFVNDVEFDMHRCTCSTTLKDRGFEARIRNNKRIKAHVNSDLSKNEVTITPATTVISHFFNPTNGVYSYTDRGAYRVGDVFRYLIDFMSDGQLGFYSTLFSDGYAPEWYNLMIVQGEIIRTGLEDESHPAKLYIDFETLFVEVDKKIPISATVENIAGVPTIVIERRSATFDTTLEAATHRSIGGFEGERSLIAKTDTSRWYSKVVVGSEKTQKQDGTFEYPDVRFANWKVEEYHVMGTCNTDNEFELIGNYIVDSNVIEDMLPAGSSNDAYDDDIVIFEAEPASGSAVQAIAYDMLGNNGRIYNRLLQNEFVIERYAQELPNGIAQFITVEAQNDLFKAQLTANDTNGGMGYTAGPIVIGFPDPYPFNDELFDYNNRYNDTTFRYTAALNGFYRFIISMHVINLVFEGPFAGDLEFTIHLRKYDSADVLIETQTGVFTVVNGTIPPGADAWVTFNTPGSYGNATDYWDVALEAQQLGPGPEDITFDLGLASYFEAVYAFIGGGVVASGDPATYRARLYEYSYPITYSQWLQLIEDKNGYITFNPQQDSSTDRQAFIETISYALDKGRAEITLIN